MLFGVKIKGLRALNWARRIRSGSDFVEPSRPMALPMFYVAQGEQIEVLSSVVFVFAIPTVSLIESLS
jgi:hypothetical protein